MANEPVLLADTITLSWYVLAPNELTTHAVKAMQEQTVNAVPIAVSAYSLVELGYHVEKGTMTAAELAAIRAVLDDPAGLFVVLPMDDAIASMVRAIPRDYKDKTGKLVKNADPGDRIIAATAVIHGLSVITPDEKLRRLSEVHAGVKVVWNAPVV